MSWLARLDAALAQRTRETGEESEGRPDPVPAAVLRSHSSPLSQPASWEANRLGHRTKVGDSEDAVGPRDPLRSLPSPLSRQGGGAEPVGDHPARAAAALLHAARQAAEALAAPDADLDHERAEIAAALAAEARGGFGQPMSDADHRAALAGLSAAALQRPPGWSDPADSPPPGAWCSCCGRQHRAGGRWWREAVEPKGWRCWTCHPPVHLSGAELAEVRT